MRFTGSRLVAMGILGLVLLAGCGGGDDQPSSTSTLPTTSVAPEVTTTTVAPVTTTRPAPTETSADPPITRDCPNVIFDNDGENAAYSITATGLSCEDAEAFIQQVRRTLTAVGPAEADLEGYHCVRTGQEDFGMPSSDYRCTAGSKTVTFGRS